MITRTLNEGESISEAISFDTFGFIPDVVIDWDADLSVSGSSTATEALDFTYDVDLGESSATITFDALVDMEAEDIETVIFELSGYIDYVEGSSNTSHTNILGAQIRGNRVREQISERVQIEIDSIPVFEKGEDITYLGTGSSSPVGSLLDLVTDGVGEALTVIPKSIEFSGVDGRVEENGDIVLTSVAADGPDGFTVTADVQDPAGNSVEASQFVRLAKLTLPGNAANMFFIEGEPGPTYNFSLSAPLDYDLQVQATLVDPTGQADVELVTGTIPAGSTGESIQLLSGRTDNELELDETGLIDIRVTGNEGPVSFGLGGSFETEHRVQVELQDRVFAGLEETQVSKAVSAVNTARGVLLDDFLQILVKASKQDDILDAFNGGVKKFSSALGVALDAAEIRSNYVSRLEAAYAIEDPNQRADALYDATRAAYVDVWDKGAEALFVQGSSAAIVGAMVSFGVIANPIGLTALAAGIGISWAGKMVYNATIKNAVRQKAADHFGDGLNREQFKETLDKTGKVPNPILPNPLGLKLGTEGDDSLTGDAGNDTLIAGLGNDVVKGGYGDDRLWAGAGDTGNDELFGGSGNDILAGGGGNDSLYADEGRDTLYGGDGDDSLFAASAEDTRRTEADVLWGGAGNDTVSGSFGDNVLGGGAGNDDIRGVGGDNTIYGGGGDDTIRSEAGADLVYGGAGADDLNARDGNDTIFNGGGDDTIEGEGGDDLFWGGGGNDVMNGGTGADTFAFAAGNGADTVGDFSLADGDALHFSGLGLDTEAQAIAAMTQSGADVVIAVADITVTIEDITISDFQAATGWLLDTV